MSSPIHLKCKSIQEAKINPVDDGSDKVKN